MGGQGQGHPCFLVDSQGHSYPLLDDEGQPYSYANTQGCLPRNNKRKDHVVPPKFKTKKTRKEPPKTNSNFFYLPVTLPSPEPETSRTRPEPDSLEDDNEEILFDVGFLSTINQSNNNQVNLICFRK